MFTIRTIVPRAILLVLLFGLQESPKISNWNPDPNIEKAVAAVSPAELETTIRALVACGTRHSATESADENPSSRGIGAARRYLVKRFREISQNTGGRLEVREDFAELVSDRRLPGGRARGANVIARLPGVVEPERIVVISGHYDSINKRFDIRRGGIDTENDAPGADDDGSGTALTVECARVLSNLQFPATIEFACYTAEEQGLLGSKEHARQLKQAGAEVIGILNNDIVGSSTAGDGVKRDDYIRVFSSCPSGQDSPSRNLARHALDVARLYFKDQFRVNLILRTDRYGRGGDHTSFENEGFPGIRFTEPVENYYHQHEDVRDEKNIQYGDRIEFVDFNYLAKVARVNAALAAELAAAPAPPSRVAVDGALRNDTKVSLKSRAADRLAGYEAVARETQFNNWSKSFPMAGESAVLPLLIDDHFVGVRAVSKDGRRSVAVVPPEPVSSFAASGPASRQR